jgi:hypothetical protein
MLRRRIVPLLGGLLVVAAGGLWLAKSFTSQPAPLQAARQADNAKGNVNLPLSQVVLFSSGVGYFQREGEVEGTSRIDMQFPIGDVNDLLKSLVLQDLGKGKIGVISYDSQDPVDKTLRSFALDLTNNPSFGQLLNQARGERVEIFMQQNAGAQPATMSGVILGMESQAQPHRVSGALHEVHMLNLLCAEGLRSIPMTEVQRVRFLNPKLETELRRALEVLASTHDQQKKLVSLNFKGEGKRSVRVGYVAENPIWKTSYRLSLHEKHSLQGWAAVENVTDEDWNDVRVVLVSGRPISFQMDLYPPLFVPRPTVEPERFASLRPPTYGGALTTATPMMGALGGAIGGAMPPMNGMNLPPGFGGQAGFGGQLGFGGGNLGGQFGWQGGQFNNRYQNQMPMNNPVMTNAAPQQLGQTEANQNNDANANFFAQGQNKLNFEQLMERRKKLQDAKGDAKKVGEALSKLDPHQSVASIAEAEEIGDAFRYIIEERVSLPRQKSALLPLLDESVTAKRVSIYNESVHSKFALLGLKFKNSTGKPLTQGPITIYDDGSYAGDARLPDLQPDEERLLSYAIDLGTEIKPVDEIRPGPQMTVRTSANTVHVGLTLRHTRTYVIRNRSKQDRVIVIEHPVRAGWTLAEPKKPVEQTRDLYRFEVPVAAGKTVEFPVAEEQPRRDPFAQQWAKTPRPDTQELHFVTGMQLEIDRLIKASPPELLNMRVVKGTAFITSKLRHTHTYRVLNRADKETRKVTVEHAVPAGWKLVGDAVAAPGTTDLFRFPLTIEAGKSGSHELVEESAQTVEQPLTGISDERMREILAGPAVIPAVRDALRKVLELRARLADTTRKIAETDKQLKGINEDQARLRQNLDKVPQSSAAHKRYLEKFDKQETEIEQLQDTLKKVHEADKRQKEELDEFIKGLTIG